MDLEGEYAPWRAELALLREETAAAAAAAEDEEADAEEEVAEEDDGDWVRPTFSLKSLSNAPHFIVFFPFLSLSHTPPPPLSSAAAPDPSTFPGGSDPAKYLRRVRPSHL